MDGAKAPPPPRFDQIAAKFGLEPHQLQHLLSKDPGMFQQLAHQYAQQNAMQQNQLQNQQAAQGYMQLGQPGVQGFHNMQSPGFAPPPVSPPSDEELQSMATIQMNPIAREKYEPVFKLLGIRARCANQFRGGGTEWVLAKAARDGKQFRQTWSAPDNDPGCSLRLWDAMVGELMDNIKKYDDAHTSDNNRTQVAGK